jgi:hypothetical protein
LNGQVVNEPPDESIELPDDFMELPDGFIQLPGQFIELLEIYLIPDGEASTAAPASHSTSLEQLFTAEDAEDAEDRKGMNG